MEEAQALAAEILPIFEAQAVDREAIMALALAIQADAGQMAGELIGSVVSLARRGHLGRTEPRRD